MVEFTLIYKNSGLKTKVKVKVTTSSVASVFTSQSHRVIKSTPSKPFVGEILGLDNNGVEVDAFTAIATVTSYDGIYDLDIIYDKNSEMLFIIPSLNGIENNTAIAIEGYAVTKNIIGDKDLFSPYDGAKFNLIDSAVNCNLALVNVSGLGRGMPSNLGDNVDEGYMEILRDDVTQFIIFGTYKSVSGDAFSKEFTASAPTQVTMGKFCLRPLVKATHSMIAIPVP